MNLKIFLFILIISCSIIGCVVTQHSSSITTMVDSDREKVTGYSYTQTIYWK